MLYLRSSSLNADKGTRANSRGRKDAQRYDCDTGIRFAAV